MDCKRNIFIRDFFVIDSNKAKCKNCGGSYSAQSTTNLKRHFAKEHSEMYKQIEKEKRPVQNAVAPKKEKLML